MRKGSAEGTSASQGAVLAEKIRDAILTQRFRPGDRLNETSLAREFGASRIPIREALMRLEEQGLAVSQPRRGMFVNSLSAQETRQVNSVRLVLEAEALKLCQQQCTAEMVAHLSAMLAPMEAWQGGSQWEAAELDLEFHRAMWRFSGNECLEKTLNTLCTVLFAHRALDAIGDDRMRWMLSHHRSLLEVVEGRSEMTPEEAIVGHVQIGYDAPEEFSSFAIKKPIAVE